MDEISVKTAALKSTVEENLKKHIAEYKTAMEVYAKDMVEAYTKKLEEVKAGKYDTSIRLTPPVSNEADYKKVLTALSWSVDETIKISADELDAYVNDNWNWRITSKIINASYLSKL